MTKKLAVLTAEDKTILARVTKEMAEPRLAESVSNKIYGTEESLDVMPIEKPALYRAKRT